MADKTNEQKYKKLSDIDHVLLRPGMYIGSVVSKESETFVFNGDTNKFELTTLTYNPGFLKLFDEIISNSVDESKRNKKLNLIKVRINTSKNEISVYDNGGIPVELHKQYKQYIPELVFSNLKAGSNFNDDEKRDVVGVNGVGSSCVNIFSTKFIVKTADKSNSFEQIFYDNMRKRYAPKIAKTRDHYTEIIYYPDLARFNMQSIDADNLLMIEKRIYEVAACNTGLTVEYELNGEKKTIKFKSFQDYAKLYNDNILFEQVPSWEIGVGESIGLNNQISYVNGVETYDGGSHVVYVANQIINYLREKIKKKYKVDVKPADIRSHFSLFINCTIINPAFSSQTKEKLITEPKNFGSEYIVSEKLLKQIFNSEIIQSILDWAKRKSEADEAAALRKAQKGLDRTKIAKLIDAKKKGLRNDCVLQIYEGDSASNAVRQYRDPQLQGAFPIRGKFLNVFDLEPSRVMQNEEVKSICAAMGLKIGERATATNLRYGKVAIYSDADTDGDCIAGLLLNFFYKYWPELVKEGRICRVETPIVVAKKGKETLKFYYDNEYQEWVDRVGAGIKQWNVEYKKGLAALENYEYKEIIQNPRMIQFTEDDTAKDQFKIWFGDDSDLRKNKILNKPIEIKEKVVEKKQEPKEEKKIEKPVVKEEPKTVVEVKKSSSGSLKERLQRNINKQAESSSKVKKGLF